MTVSESQPAIRPRYQWFQYSLRTLLVVMLLACIEMTWFRHAPSLAAEDTKKPPSDGVVTKGNEVLSRVIAETKANAQEAKAWPWSGQYYAGDGLGFNLRLAIAPKAGVVFWRYGCMGLYDLNYGSFQEKDGYMRLSFQEKNVEDPGNMVGLCPVLVPIRWGDRRYLIPETEMIAFCNHVNSGSDRQLRDALFCAHVDDRKKKTSGIPKVPPQYQPYLLKSPIEAEVAWVGKTAVVERKELWPPGRYRVTEIRLNRGKADGLLPGMELLRANSPDVRVLDVATTFCRAEAFDHVWEEDPDGLVGLRDWSIRLGLRYSTRSPPSPPPGPTPP